MLRLEKYGKINFTLVNRASSLPAILETITLRELCIMFLVLLMIVVVNVMVKGNDLMVIMSDGDNDNGDDNCGKGDLMR